MSNKFQVVSKHSNAGLFTLVILIFIGLLLLFAWQTLLFVGIVFPDEDLMIKILTVFSVDGMGFVWANLHTFYRFAHPGAKAAVLWGWGVTYLLSAILSILYLTFTYMLHFQHVTDGTVIKIGVGLSIAALMFNLGMLSIFLYKEISTRFPREDEYEIVDKRGNNNSQEFLPAAPQPTMSQLAMATGIPENTLHHALSQLKEAELERLIAAGNNNSQDTGELNAADVGKKKAK